MRFIILLFICLAPHAWANDPWVPPDYPTKAAIAGVPEGDALNIRARPNAASEDLGDLANGETLEIVGLDASGKWAQINFEESEAWIASAYLDYRAPARMEASKLPLPLQCFGTEPFWQTEITQTGFLYTDPETELRFEPIDREAHAYFDATTALIETKSYTALIKYESCSDGMSNRAYGLSISLFLEGGMIGGCCSVVPI